jgi:AmmeMemoRadiSam system protein B
MTVRQPNFAGSWYPRTDNQCQQMFEEFEQQCVSRKGSGTLRGGIVPHAGWMFSGHIAYNVVRELSRSVSEVDTVVVCGGHLHPSSPITVMSEGEFWTPFGNMPTDEELARALCDNHQVREESPKHHSPDNTIELQMPIVKHFFPEARTVIIGAPPREEMLQAASSLGDLASQLGRKILVIGSTDLTHYGPSYGFSPKGHGPQAEKWVREENDARFVELACKMDPQGVMQEALATHNACCPGAAASAIRYASGQGASEGELLTYATSSDIRADDNFVGYAGIVF